MASFRGLRPASARASKAAKASSRKRDTRCELLLRSELWRRGLRFTVDAKDLPGRPDVVFSRYKLAVFCDGDFWHGRKLKQRLGKLREGHNAAYWAAKIRSNVARDQRITAQLGQQGWVVMRFWETDVSRRPAACAARVQARLDRLRQRIALRQS
jgi:DNA mismatch endonuclease, patch repair protein